MGERLARRAVDFKARSFATRAQAARREAIFNRQREVREAVYRELRFAALSSLEPDAGSTDLEDSGDELVTTQRSSPHRRTRPRRNVDFQERHRGRYCPVALPEWLVEIPNDLSRSWYVVPRPDGKRVFVVASSGRTTLRKRDGSLFPVIGVCESDLPGGKPGLKGVTMLDCIIPADARRRNTLQLWALDVYVWNDAYMHECTAEFRFFWLRNSLEQLEGGVFHGMSVDAENGSVDVADDDRSAGRSSSNEVDHRRARSKISVAFRSIPFYDADDAGISSASDTSLTRAAGIHVQDGLLFFAKDAHVELGLTPMILAWKDDGTSLHFIETFPEPGPPNTDRAGWPLVATLSTIPSSADEEMSLLAAGDEPPVVLDEMKNSELQSLRRKAAGCLIRVQVLNTEDVAGGSAPLLKVLGAAGPARTIADSWSRILFQCMARHSPITLPDLLAHGHPLTNQSSLSSGSLARQ